MNDLKRSLPVNELEAAKIVQTLQGIVPEELLLGQVPFVEDVAAAMEMLQKQRAETMAAGQEAFGMYRDENRQPNQEEA